ncbi:MAG: tcrY [Ilumatobacteraceae bacterium]|nr:tcrY [Ilumatobacteraceae bacterium]
MSLRARLLLATILVALTALTVAGFVTYTAFSRSQLRQIDDTLQRTHEPIEQAVADNPGDPRRAIEVVAPGTFVAIEAPDGSVEFVIPARSSGRDAVSVDINGVSPPQTVEQAGAFDVPAFYTVAANDSDSDARLRLRVSRLSDGRVLLIGESLEEADDSAHRLLLIEVFVASIALLVAGLLGWVLVRIGLRPLRSVEETALVIAAGGDLEQDLPGADRSTETGKLARALNTMLGRIRDAFAERDATEAQLRASEERMRRFVADVSHELRTPLAAVSAYTELFERGARDRPEDLARAMRGIGVETDRMHELVEELLLLANLDEGRPLGRARVDLNEVIVDAITAARAVAPDWPITLRVSGVVSVQGDANRLRQVLDNVFANVRTHTPRGTTAAVQLGIRDEMVSLVIQDNGPGMSPAQAERIFERFYRSDASRSRASGGSGLGMAIVHAIIEAHGGRIRVEAPPNGGLRVLIELPVDAESVSPLEEDDSDG